VRAEASRLSELGAVWLALPTLPAQHTKDRCSGPLQPTRGRVCSPEKKAPMPVPRFTQLRSSGASRDCSAGGGRNLPICAQARRVRPCLSGIRSGAALSEYSDGLGPIIPADPSENSGFVAEAFQESWEIETNLPRRLRPRTSGGGIVLIQQDRMGNHGSPNPSSRGNAKLTHGSMEPACECWLIV
jgi:hypothetical protein